MRSPPTIFKRVDKHAWPALCLSSSPHKGTTAQHNRYIRILLFASCSQYAVSPATCSRELAKVLSSMTMVALPRRAIEGEGSLSLMFPHLFHPDKCCPSLHSPIRQICWNSRATTNLGHRLQARFPRGAGGMYYTRTNARISDTEFEE